MENIRKRNSRFALARPDFSGLEAEFVSDAIERRDIARGRYIHSFERRFRNFIGTEFSVSCSTGTAALHIALKTLGIERGDEVICPNLTFVAVPNSVLYCGAKPVFCDVSRDSWVMTSEDILLAMTKKTKAVIAVHLYGVPCEMPVILEKARFMKISVVEDCSEALGAMSSGEYVGKLGDVGTFSFYGNKTITTGEGGMLTTDIPHIALDAEHFRNHSHSSDYYHNEIGYNYRMTNIQAALGFAQMHRLSEILRKKERIRKWYNEFLDDRFTRNGFENGHNDRSVCWLYTVLVSDKDRFRKRMAEFGIETRPVFYPMNELPHLRQSGKFPNTKFISEHGVSFPSYSELTKKQVQFIAGVANDSGFLSRL